MATIIEMPKLSDTMSVGTLVTWLKKEGEKVSSGDKIAEIETDKATMEMEIFEDGVLLKQIAAAGEEVAVGDPIAAIGKEGEKFEAPAKKEKSAEPKKEEKKEEPKPAAKSKTPAPEPAAAPKAARASAVAGAGGPGSTSPKPAAPEAKPTAPKSAAPGERIKISPLARKLATELGVDPASVSGTGPDGRIVRADVEAASKNPRPAGAKAGAPSGAAPALGAIPSAFVGTSDEPVQEEKLVPVSNMRGAIARRLVESKTTVPHFYLEIEIDAAPMLELRTQLTAAFGDSAKVSVNDLILKACAHALRRVPAANCSWEDKNIHQHAAAHVSFAVAIDDGLITPVIFDAHAKSLFQISAEARALGAKAKARKLQPNEFTGGTFCVSNLGMFGISRFSAIINPPNGAILAVGATEKKPIVNAAGQIVVGQRMALVLSCDHRVVDGAVGAQFLAALKDILEKPLQILA